jgi:hypothetical protein
MVNPGDIPLPNFLNPVLSYLKDNVPQPIYTVLVNLMAHFLAFISALISLLTSLVAKHPSEWDAQTFFPPIIAILTAYLALASLYRTTAWVVRTSVWFVTWSTVIAAIIAFAGAIFRAGNGDLSLTGVVSSFMDAVSGMLNDASAKSRKARQRGTKGRPKAWESYDRHRDWQYQEDQDRAAQRDPTSSERTVEDFISNIEQSGLWKMAQGFFGGGTQEETGQNTQTGRKKAKSKSR